MRAGVRIGGEGVELVKVEGEGLEKTLARERKEVVDSLLEIAALLAEKGD